MSPPRWGVWIAPLGLFALMATTFPIAFRTRPGDTSIWPAAVAFVVVLGYGGLLVGVLLWTWLGSPLYAGTRTVLTWRREHGFDAFVWAGVLVAGLFGCFATYVVAWFYAPKRVYTIRGHDIAAADLLGWGERVERGIAVGVPGGDPRRWAVLFGLVWIVVRVARDGVADC